MREFHLGPEVEPFRRGLVAELRGESPAVGVVAFELRVCERHDLGEERVGSDELVERILEPDALGFVEYSEPLDRGVEDGVDLAVLSRVVDREQERDSAFDLVDAQHVKLVEPSTCVEEEVRVGRWRSRTPVVRLERADDLVGVVTEVEDERVALQLVDTVESRQRLDGGEPAEDLVHVHGVQQRLVEAGLELLSDDQDLVVVAPEPLRGLRLRKAVHAGLGELATLVVDHLAGERDEGREVPVTVLRDIGVDRLLVAHRVQSRRRDDHRLGLAADLRLGMGAEVLDDDLGLLSQVVRVQRNEPGDRPLRLRGLVAGVIRDRLLDATGARSPPRGDW